MQSQLMSLTLLSLLLCMDRQSKTCHQSKPVLTAVISMALTICMEVSISADTVQAMQIAAVSKSGSSQFCNANDLIVERLYQFTCKIFQYLVLLKAV